MAKFKEISHEHAREAKEPGCWENYWKNRKDVTWYIEIDDTKPEYGDETG